MKSLRILPFVVALLTSISLLRSLALAQSGPEPGGWYSGDMHVHRSCGGSPESVASMFSRMSPQNLSVVSQLADSGNGEVQNPTTDLPLVNGTDDPISQPGKLLHWDAEWHWDAIYTQYPHQALGGHLVTLGLSQAQQIWQEYTFPILDWTHQHNGIGGFAHLQYLDGGPLPSTLTCCTPIEYPVEVGLGAADFISEDVYDVDQPSSGPPGAAMFTESTIQAYYKLLNSGFRPGLAAGTDYPCNGSDNAGALGNLLTYVQIPNGQLTYRSWIQGIANGRTVVSRNGHQEFLNLTVNTNATPGDEIQLPAGGGSVQVTVQWTAAANLSGTIQLIQNGNVVATKQTTAAPGVPGSLTATVNFTNSGWLAARRMDTALGQHYVHTAAVFVVVNSQPVRANSADPQYFVNWIGGLLTNTSPGGVWNSFFPTSLAAAQTRYQAARALFQQIAAEAGNSGPTLASLALTPANPTIVAGTQQSLIATGTYSNSSSLNVTAQARWSSSNPAVATVSPRGLVSTIGPGTAVITASLGNVSTSTTLAVQAAPLLITTTSLPSGTAGISYSATLAASGGTPSYTWTVTNGSLPSGLTLNASTGNIVGTPGLAGTYNFTVQVTDSATPSQSATAQLAIAISPSGVGSCPCSIWPSSAAPSVADSGPDSAVELGVTFRSDVDGFITGLRFYKGTGNTGTHVGNLWTSTGALLATATFTGETATGWQQVNFSSPVAITANSVYVASYHTNVGHYSDDQFFFASGVDNSPLHALPDTISTPNGPFAYGGTSSFPNQSWHSSNYWVDVVFMPANVSTPPAVTSVSPPAGATGISIGTAISATFNHSMSVASITSTTFALSDSTGNQVSASVTYTPATSTAVLTPNAELAPSTTYTARVVGGSGGVQDLSGNTMASDFTWSFTTGAAPQPNGPGGPILVISNVSNPFSRYYSEILNAEGLNEYTVADMSTVTSTTLTNYDVVILGEMSLSSAQATMLANWVNAGGRLIAMRPDKQLAGLLGLTATGSTLSNAYLKVQTNSGPGNGIVGQTIQFHGPADLYTPTGASTVATLFSNASTATAFPAVTLANAGSGQAAAFTYDLARSIVYTRQGNPAWSGQARDGQSGPIRSDDLYFGAASFDPEPDWVDLTNVAIPQADEQQRFLANLILQMDSNQKPLPRFWYFPSGFKAVIVMTGDDHGSFYSGSATSNRFSDFLAASAPGCSVIDWQCVRATAYLFPQALASNPLSNSQAAAYVAQGFEIGVHADSSPTCSNWTKSQLDSVYTNLLGSLAAQFPSLPAPKTHRMHCISWSDYDSQPQVELAHGIRLDTSYYYWPPTWVNDQPGMFTGSGMPMRYTDRNGNIIDVYQATTQMTDESGQSYPLHSDTLLANALGTTGYYGAFVVNAHNDQGSYPGIAPAIVNSAQSRGVPIVSAQQMLTWLDARNSSSFGSILWSGNTLSFNVVQGSGARNLQGMLPSNGPTGTLSSIIFNGSPISFTTQTIKGVSYGTFNATAGSYQAVYGGAPPTVVLSSVTLNPASVVGGTGSTGTVTLTGQAPTGGALVTLSSSNTAVAQVGVSSVTVPAGSTTANFALTTNTVSTSTPVIVSGIYPTGTTQTATLTVTPPPVTLLSVSLNPSTVAGGAGSTGTVTLSGPAPTGGAAVSLSSSNTVVAQVTVSSVTVPAGSTTATFSVTTSAVSTSTPVTISGTYPAGTTQTATLTVTAPVISVSSVSLSPTAVVGGNNSTGTVVISTAAPTGGTVVTLSSSNTAAATVPASVTIPAGGTSATFAVITQGVASQSSAIITATKGNSASATLTVNVASLSSITKTPATVVGGANSTGTVTLNGAAPPGGALISLLSGNTSVAQVPTSVTIAAGLKSATFTITTTPVAANTAVVLSATYGTITRTTTLNVNAATLSSVTKTPSSVVGGNSSTGTVTLNGPAPAGGATVALQSSNTAAAQVPGSVLVLAGSKTATFPITTSPVAASTSVTMSATYAGITRTTILTVNAAGFTSLTLSPSTVIGGNSSTATVKLNGAAPPAGAFISLTSSNTIAAHVPPSVTIPSGSNSATFAVTTSAVHGTSSIISGTYGLTTRTATLTIQ